MRRERALFKSVRPIVEELSGGANRAVEHRQIVLFHKAHVTVHPLG
jgi:hypothetical protein